MKFFNFKHDVKIKNAFVLLVGSLLFTVAINMFVGPGGLYVGGLTGVLQIVIMIVDDLFNITLSLGLLVLLCNLPILWLAWKSVGKRFAILTIISVVTQSLLFEIIPIYHLIDDVMINAIFGGVLVGIGSGMILKIGASAGGMDVVSQVMSYKFNGSVGKYSFIINAFVIGVAGYYQSWEVAMYTIISIYISSLIVDKIHTIHQNLTLYIVTQKEDDVKNAIWSELYRGITVLEAAGAYTNERRNVLMMVLSSYELYEALAIIKACDTEAFINVVRSEAVIGHFVKKKLY
ncbi:MAG: YitT family protein [Defluviitaleaceae bacterium]|nr:YitT family protein [Defluviitaleaceae bacterium]